MGDIVYRERVLTVCRWGCVRSVALREALVRELGVDSVAIGLEKNSTETIQALAGWADIIVVASDHLMQCRRAALLPPGKTVILNLGKDVWQNARNPVLYAKCKEELAPLFAQIRKTRNANKLANPPRSSRLPT